MDRVIFFIGLGLFFFLFTCWAIIDIARKDFGGIEIKLLWGVITLIPFIGPIIYLAIGYRKGRKGGGSHPKKNVIEHTN